MLFVFTGTDNPNSLELRLSTRPAHLEFLKEIAESGALKLGGPFLDADGKPCGSMLVIEAPDAAAAKALVDRDPYAGAGVFASTEIRQWNWTFGKPDTV
jgi:hypothetical protein